MKKLIGGLLAVALLLTSVPLLDAGGVTAKAEGETGTTATTDELAGYTQLTGFAYDSDAKEHPGGWGLSNAFDGNENNLWHTLWDNPQTAGGVVTDQSYFDINNPEIRYNTTKSKNNITITFRTTSEVKYIEYYTRTGGTDGMFRKMQVSVRKNGATEFTPVDGKHLDQNRVTVDFWTRTMGVKYIFKLDTVQSDVAEVRITALEVYSGNANNSHMSAREIKIFGKETPKYGDLITGLKGTAPSEQKNYRGQNAVDGDLSTGWYSTFDESGDIGSLPVSENDNMIKNNEYIITLPGWYDVNAISYYPLSLEGGTKTSNGTISVCRVMVSSDSEGDKWTDTEKESAWRYDLSTDEGKRECAFEKILSLVDDAQSTHFTNVKRIKIFVKKTLGNVPEKNNVFISAKEFNVYGTKSTFEGAPIDSVSVNLKAAPDVGSVPVDFNFETTDTTPSYTVESTTWTKKKGGQAPDTFARYEKYIVAVKLNANEGHYFSENCAVSLSIGEINEAVTSSCEYENQRKKMIVKFEYNKFAETKKVYYDKDGDGKIDIPKEDMPFFNNLEGITVNVLFRHKDIPTNGDQDKRYSLFSLGNDSKYFTIWHQPSGDVCYSFTGSTNGLKWGNSNANTEDEAWHKLSFSLLPTDDGENWRWLCMMNGKTTVDGQRYGPYYQMSSTSGAVHRPKLLLSEVFTWAAVGEVRQEASGNEISTETFPGMIKYVEIVDGGYSDLNGLSTSENNVVRPEVQEEFTGVSALVDDSKKEDFNVDKWPGLQQTKDGLGTLNTDWALANGTDTLNKAIKDSVCHHVFKNGECITCGLKKQGPTAYTVTVVNKDGKNSSSEINCSTFGAYESVTTQPITTDGTTTKYFQCWKNQKDKIVSYQPTYDFYVTGDMTLMAVYDDTKQETAPQPAMVVSNTYAKEVAGRNRVYFECTRSIPASYKVLEQGVLYCTSATYMTGTGGGELKLKEGDTNDWKSWKTVNDKVKKCAGQGTAHRGVFTFTAAIDSRYLDKDVYVVGYAIVRDSLGNVTVIYTDQASGSYKGLL